MDGGKRVKGSCLFGQVQLKKKQIKQVCHPMIPMSWVYNDNAMSISVGAKTGIRVNSLEIDLLR